MNDSYLIQDTDKASFWQQHLAQWHSSGLTQKHYCHGVKGVRPLIDTDQSGTSATVKFTRA